MSKSNFEFLKGANDILFNMALAAEKNFHSDPNTTLIKLRMFGESLAKHLAKVLRVDTFGTQADLLRELAKYPRIDSTIIRVLHELRSLGNKAVHDNYNDRYDAEMCLRSAFRLALWYFRLISNNLDYPSPMFVLPNDDQTNTFNAQILDLKEALAAALTEKTESKTEIAEHKNNLVALKGHISILEGKKVETEAQSQARIDALESQLKLKDEELEKKTERERKEYKEYTQRAAERKLNLSEQETRFLIDQQLRKAGWEANSQDLTFANGTRPQASRNIAIAEWPTSIDETGKLGFADYVLFVGLKPMAIIEAKKSNTDVSAKLNEAYRYSKFFNHDLIREELIEAAANDDDLLDLIAEHIPDYTVSWPDTDGQYTYKIPFCYSANGREYRSAVKTKSGIWYRDVRHNTNQPKALPGWHRPEELVAKLGSDDQTANAWFENNDMAGLGLRYYQEEAVRAVENAVTNGQQEMLLAMATGTGKTRTAIALMFRLIQSQRFKRVLFLVDRRSLGKQALDSFEDTRINGDTFNSIFNVKGLTDKFPEDTTKIHVATVQSLVKRTLQSDDVMPVGRYDCIIVDEAHRGYILDKEQTEGEETFRNSLDYVSSYRRIIDHFDAVKVALTATPALHTTDIFNLPVYRYSYRKAVIDGFLVDQEPPIKITTQKSQDGIYMSKGEQVERLSNQGELVDDTLEDEQDFEVADFNRKVVAPNYNKAICGQLAKELDPTSPQKTLIFCVNNDHADTIVEQLRSAFSAKYPALEYNAILKITGDSDKDPDKVQSMITRFKKERLPNIVVTVDLLSTGIDIPSICNIVFLRKVKSRILYEQMKGRATRLCPEVGKVAFKIYDAVDLYDTLESVDTMRPVVVRPSVDLNTLVNEITDSETYKVIEADGRSFAEHSHEQLVSKLQRIISHAEFNRDKSPEIDKTIKRFDDICADIAGCDFNNFAKTIKDKGPRQTAEILTKANALGLDFVSRVETLKVAINDLRQAPIFTDIPDTVISVTREYGDYDNAEDFLEAFDQLVKQGDNAHAALQTVITKPRDLTRKSLIELQEWFDRANFEESSLRTAWKETKNQDVAARLIGHIRRAAIGDALMPFETRVDNALTRIVAQRPEGTDNMWSAEQLTWLDRLASSLKDSVVLDDDTFKTGNYKRRGGKPKLTKTFGDEFDTILSQFSDYIWDQPA